jgi:acyl-[acyl carrier protein]--UDP-N-acetylglucosamine O-acyltransferase
MDDLLNIITDGYLEDSDVSALMSNQEVDGLRFVRIDYEEPEVISKILTALVGPTICLSGPGAFSYERAMLFQQLSANKKIYDYAAKYRGVGAKVGKWSWVSDGVDIADGATIGAMTTILDDVFVGRDAKVGNFCWLDDAVKIGSGVVVQNHVTIHKGVHLGRGARVLTQTEIRRDVTKFAEIGGVIETDFYSAKATYVLG